MEPVGSHSGAKDTVASASVGPEEAGRESPAALSVNGKEYRILALLGKGKGGYSYLAEAVGAEGDERVVLKQIHHEPCAYYAFGNKIEAERGDYRRLTDVGIRMPRLLEIDTANERILKEYIDGPTVAELVRGGGMRPEYLEQVRDMERMLRAVGLNIDWYPTNFVVRGGLLHYVDYECNPYSDEWSFENWGVKYWTFSPEFRAAFG